MNEMRDVIPNTAFAALKVFREHEMRRTKVGIVINSTNSFASARVCSHMVCCMAGWSAGDDNIAIATSK